MDRASDRIAPRRHRLFGGRPARGRLSSVGVLFLLNSSGVSMIAPNDGSKPFLNAMTTEEAARILKVSTRLVTKWAKQGRIRGRLLHQTMWLLDADDVRRFAAIPRKPGNPRLRKS